MKKRRYRFHGDVNKRKKIVYLFHWTFLTIFRNNPLISSIAAKIYIAWTLSWAHAKIAISLVIDKSIEI